LKKTKELMGALLRMKPKAHDKIKVGKSKRRRAKSAAKATSS
jgi:hypothetical protein